MPIYEYRCTACHRTFEVIQKVGDAPPESCIHCSGAVEKLISRTSFQLKGGGWFQSDYGGAKSKTTKDANGASADSAPSDSSGAKKTDSASKDAPKAGGCASGSCGCSS